MQSVLYLSKYWEICYSQYVRRSTPILRTRSIAEKCRSSGPGRLSLNIVTASSFDREQSLCRSDQLAYRSQANCCRGDQLEYRSQVEGCRVDRHHVYGLNGKLPRSSRAYRSVSPPTPLKRQPHASLKRALGI